MCRVRGFSCKGGAIANRVDAMLADFNVEALARPYI